MTSQYDPIIVDVWRGPSVESRHQLVASVVDDRGAEVTRYGDADFSTCWRSSAKPFQARPWVDDGTIDHFGWSVPETAIICASHVGAPVHVDLVRRMLTDIGLSEDDLRCDRKLKAAHNCSGNHTGMLAACVYHGWDVAGYQRADHPAQVAGIESVAEATGIAAADMPCGVDGCGIVVYATPVTAMARGYARLPRLAPRIAAAMLAHPVFIEGEGEEDTVIMQAFPGVISKGGAEGLCCAALPDGWGIAVKALDGASRAPGLGLIALLVRHLGLPDVPELARRRSRPPVVDSAGDVVGAGRVPARRLSRPGPVGIPLVGAGESAAPAAAQDVR